MRVRAYDAGDGDCVLVTSGDGVHALFDGGRKATFDSNTIADLGALGAPLDLVCVSHVDNDHIQGLVRLIDGQIKRAVHQHQAATGNANAVAPGDPAIAINELWHNAFDEVTGDQSGSIASALAAHHRMLSHFVTADGAATSLWTTASRSAGSRLPDLEDVARSDRFATGFLEGIELGRKARIGTLGIRLNHDFRRKRPPLVKRPGRRETDDDIPERALGSTRLRVLAPTHRQLTEFGEQWKQWAADNADRIAALARDIESLLDTTAAGEPRIVEFARRSAVTPQNLVSIVVLAEESGHRVLLTGDTHQEDILDGLRAAGELVTHRPGQPTGMHVDVLKVQHHGSPNNLDAEFASRVTADHYVFCGNGASRNPAPKVIDDIIDSRVAPAGHKRRAVTPQAGDPFHLWFTTHPDRAGTPSRRDHMQALFDHVRQRMTDHPGAFGASALNGPCFDITPGQTPIRTTFQDV